MRAACILSFCLINKKKEKKTLCGDCSNSMMDVVVRLREGESNDRCAKERNAAQFPLSVADV